jgi:hypothetical protein
MCPHHLYSIFNSLWGIAAMENVVVCLMFICKHERILEMFVRNCDKVKKAAGGIQTLFGQRDKGHM